MPKGPIAKNASGGVYAGTERGQLYYWDGLNLVKVPDLLWHPEDKTLRIIERIVDRTNSVGTTTATVENSTAEEEIYRGAIEAFELRAGNYVKADVSGVVSNASASDDFTLRVYMGSHKLEEFKPAIGNVTDGDWHVAIKLTVRSIGTSGQVAMHIDSAIAGHSEQINSLVTLDTEVAEDLTVTIQWDNALAANVAERYQGALEFKH